MPFQSMDLQETDIVLLSCRGGQMHSVYQRRQSSVPNHQFPKNTEIQQLQRKISDLFFHYKMAKLCLEYKKYSEVVRVCSDGLKIDAQNTRFQSLFRFNRGKAHKQIGNRQQALQDFRATLELDEDFIQCIQERIFIYVQLKKYELAIYEYQLLKVKNPANQTTYEQRMNELEQLKLKNSKEGQNNKIIAIIPMEQFNPPLVKQSSHRNDTFYENIIAPQGEEQYGQYDDQEDEQGQCQEQEESQTIINTIQTIIYTIHISKFRFKSINPTVEYCEYGEDW